MATETKSILETVLAKAHEKAIPHELPAETPKTEVTKTETSKTETAKTNLSATPPKESEELIAARKRIAELESANGEKEKRIETLSKLEKARELWKGKKRIEAIEILAEVQDIEPELDEFVKEYVAAPSRESKSAVEAKIDQLLEKDQKREEEAKKAKEEETKRAEEAKKAEADRIKEENIRYTNSIIDKHVDQFDLCGREKNRKEVGEKAPIIALEVLRRDKIDLKAITAEQAEKAMIEALTEIESDLEKQGLERFVKKARQQAKTETEEAPAQPEKKQETASRVPPPAIKVNTLKKPASVMDVIENAKKRAVFNQH